MTMSAMRFRQGERVRSRITIGSVRVGTLGTVQDALPSATHVYSVQFDDTAFPYLMDAHMLSRLPQPRIVHASHRRARVWRCRTLASRRKADRLIPFRREHPTSGRRLQADALV